MSEKKKENGADSKFVRWDPFKYTIIGLDVTADELLSRFTGDRPSDQIARSVIKGVQDKDRLDAPTPGDIALAKTAKNIPRVTFATIGPDRDGAYYDVIVAGRQRGMTLRIVNQIHEEAGEPHLKRVLSGERHVFRFDPTADTELEAMLMLNLENQHKRETLLVLANRAANFRARGLTDEAIAVQMTRSDEGPLKVADLLAWADLFPQLTSRAIQRAEAGKLSVRQAKRLAGLSEKEQHDRLDRMEFPGRYKVGRPKSISANKGKAIADEAERVGMAKETVAIMRYFAGDADAIADHPRLKKIVESAGATGGDAE